VALTWAPVFIALYICAPMRTPVENLIRRTTLIVLKIKRVAEAFLFSERWRKYAQYNGIDALKRMIKSIRDETIRNVNLL
jgi:hypothetical protein